MKLKLLFFICFIFNINFILYSIPTIIPNDFLDVNLISYIIDDINNDGNNELVTLIMNKENHKRDIGIYKLINNKWKLFSSYSNIMILSFSKNYFEFIDAPFSFLKDKYQIIKFDLNHDSKDELIIPSLLGPNKHGIIILNLNNNIINLIGIIDGFSYCIKENKEYYLLGYQTGDSALLNSKYGLYESYKMIGDKLVKQELLSDYVYNYILYKKISDFDNKKDLYKFVSIFYFIYENKDKEEAKKWYFDNINKLEYKENEKNRTEEFLIEFRKRYLN